MKKKKIRGLGVFVINAEKKNDQRGKKKKKTLEGRSSLQPMKKKIINLQGWSSL